MKVPPAALKTKEIALLVAMLLSFTVHGQVRDTLHEVKVKARRKQVSNDERLRNFSPGQKVTTVDSITLEQYRFQSIGSLLAQQVPVFVKSYGFNSLATLSFRGASAAQSQVYWNGIPLQNASLGITDVSTLRTSSFNKVSIVYGGSSALWGSGNVGGALVLENRQPYFNATSESKSSMSLMAGSFGQYQASIQSSLSIAKWYMAANIDVQSANNNFKYTDNGMDFQTINSHLKGLVAQLTAARKINDKNQVAITAWAQNYYREIPKASFESSSIKNQRDAAIRLIANWDRKTECSHLYVKLAYLQDYIHYIDSAVLLDTKSLSHQVFGEIGFKYNINTHHQLLVFAPVQTAWMQRPLLNDIVRQNRVALAAAYSLALFQNKLNVSVSGRAMLIDTNAIPLAGINASYAFTNWFAIRGNVQRSYRAPTLNELYYVPGGNDKLKPEQGWSEDAGYTVKTNTSKNFTFYHDLSYFNRNIHDWIIWFGGSIWTPHNIATVHSRGIETENRLEYKWGNWQIHLGLNTAYVLATTIQSYLPGDGSIDKQIPYTPRYNGQLNAGFGFKRFYFNYNHTYTGYRFITVDESSWLLPYNTGNIQAMYTLTVKKSSIRFSAQCNNVWNKQYMIVAGRPMPGVNWLAGITYAR